MSLQATVVAGVARAFQATGDMKVAVVHNVIVGGVYDPVTGDTTHNTTIQAGDGLVTESERQEVGVGDPGRRTAGSKLLNRALVVLLQGADFPVEIMVDDTISIDGAGYEVGKVDIKAGGALLSVEAVRVGA